ncbi:MAG TPA: chemotaxis protein CheW [Anaeromyxobacteraceae bacterium]|nr:chemotaxis protein CheW [Anaeromyxobacteraceae bacterium]
MSAARERDRAPDEALVELCAFRVGEEEYVLDIRRIREIIHPQPVTAVPRAPAWMEGVIDLRGEVLPLIDVRKRLGLPPRTSSRRAKILIVNVAGRILGLLVDAVSEVVRIPRSAIGPPPALLAQTASGARLFLGVVGTRASAANVRPGRAQPRPQAQHPNRSRGVPQVERLRLLLNVKALIDPSVVAAPATAAPPERRSP